MSSILIFACIVLKGCEIEGLRLMVCDTRALTDPISLVSTAKVSATCGDTAGDKKLALVCSRPLLGRRANQLSFVTRSTRLAKVAWNCTIRDGFATVVKSILGLRYNASCAMGLSLREVRHELYRSN